MLRFRGYSVFAELIEGAKTELSVLQGTSGQNYEVNTIGRLDFGPQPNAGKYWA
jgi:hypothetical protein